MNFNNLVDSVLKEQSNPVMPVNLPSPQERAVKQQAFQQQQQKSINDITNVGKSALELAKILDPSGILSWGDVKQAYDAYVKDPTGTNSLMFLLALGSVVPVMGKASKALKMAVRTGEEQAVKAAINPLISAVGDVSREANALQKAGIDPAQVEQAQQLASRVTQGTNEIKSLIRNGKVDAWRPGGAFYYDDPMPKTKYLPLPKDISQREKVGYVMRADRNLLKSPTVTGSEGTFTVGPQGRTAWHNMLNPNATPEEKMKWGQEYYKQRKYGILPNKTDAGQIQSLQKVKWNPETRYWEYGKERDFTKFRDRYNRLFGPKQETFNVDKWTQGGGTLGRGNKATKEGLSGLLQHIGIPFREEELTRDGLTRVLSQKVNQDKLYQFLKNNPIEMKRFPELYNEITDGNHRFELAKLAGIMDIPVKYKP